MQRIKQPSIVLAISLLFGSLSSGCSKEEDIICTGHSAPSMMVSVVDELGHQVADPMLVVEFQRESDKPWELCSKFEQYVGNVVLPVWRCGGDIEGTFNVRATLGEMSGRTDGVRVKMADRCHVQTREVDLILQ